MSDHPPTTGTWVDQWARVKRWLSRLSETNAGRPHDHDSDMYQDDVYAFFQNCYHLKDWLQHDPATAELVQADIEGYITKSPSLSLCADLCNGSKHLQLRNSRTGRDTAIGPRHVELTLGPDVLPTIAVTYEILSGNAVVDAFALAQDCIAVWEAYLQGKQLL